MKRMGVFGRFKCWWDIRLMEKLCMKVAWLLPRRLVYWCTIRLLSHATTGPYGSQIVPDLTAMEALRRW